jgi:DNA invertase Pin-like site-specific DNA recombinase
MFVQILGSLAEFERALIRERILMGLDHARGQGKRLGRPKVNDDEIVRRLRGEGLSYHAIERRLGISKGAVCRALCSVPPNWTPLRG